jgi:N-terminal domain of NWD NACHT-NTPase
VKGLDQVSLITIQFNSVEQELQSKPSDSPGTVQVQSELESRIVKLFSEIVEYQARTVLYFFRGSGARTLRDFVKADDWEELLEQIRQSQNTCSGLITQIRSNRSESWLSRLVRENGKR